MLKQTCRTVSYLSFSKKKLGLVRSYGMLLALLFIVFISSGCAAPSSNSPKSNLKSSGESSASGLMQGSADGFAADSSSIDALSSERSSSDQASASTAGEAGKPSTWSLYYRVVRVIDGDTIKVDILGKIESVRLIGVDTPETVDRRRPVQCFGKEAAKFTTRLTLGKVVSLEGDPTQADRDKFGRLLRYVHVQRGAFLNKELIAQGYAFEYTYNIPYAYQDEFMTAEKNAREAERGLWSEDTCSGKP